MDERSAAEVLDQVRDAMIVSSDEGDKPHLAAALDFMTSRLHETRFPEIVSSLIFQRSKIERLFDRYGGLNESGLRATIAALKSILTLEADETTSQALTKACLDTPINNAALKRALAALSSGSKTDQERAAVMAGWLDDASQRVLRFDDYSGAFLTQEKQPRKTLATKDACKADPDVLPILQHEAARLAAVHDRLARLKTAEATTALLTIALEILASYRNY